MPDHYDPSKCSRVSEVLARVGDKWSVLVIMMLGRGPHRFNELKRNIGGVSQRMLTLTLRSLERDGLISRAYFQTIPPKVEYALTDLGKSLRVPVEALGSWAIDHVSEVDQARAEFDKTGCTNDITHDEDETEPAAS